MLADARQTFLSAVATLMHAAVAWLKPTTSVVVVVVGRLSVVVVVLTGFGTLVVDTVVVVVDVVVVGRSDVVVVVGRGRVVVVVRCGFEQATTQASYLTRAAARHAGSRLVHAPPSETHCRWQALMQPPLLLFPWLELDAAMATLDSKAIAAPAAPARRTHLAAAVVIRRGSVIIAAAEEQDGCRNDRPVRRCKRAAGVHGRCNRAGTTQQTFSGDPLATAVHARYVAHMIDLYYWPTPNGWKVSIMLEECGLPYRVQPVNIGRGEQFSPAFLKLSPNNRMPAIVDDDPPGGGEPLAIFESAAILQYLAEKTGRFLPRDVRGKYDVLQWVAWQVANLGPIAGQMNHFAAYAPEKIPYAIDRFANEMNRLLGVLERRLADRSYLAGDYSIADMATWPWIFPEYQGRKVLADFPKVARWWETVGGRPAVKKGRAVGEELRRNAALDDEARKVLFGQTAATVASAEAASSRGPRGA